MIVTPLEAVVSMMAVESHPWEFYLDTWLDCPISGIDSEDDLRELYEAVQRRRRVN